MTITTKHGIHLAANRTIVTARLPDGRTITGRLHTWPRPRPGHGKDQRARIVLPSGAWLSVPINTITTLDPS